MPKDEACMRWGAHWRNLANTPEQSMSGSDATFLSNYFDHLSCKLVIFAALFCISGQSGYLSSVNLKIFISPESNPIAKQAEKNKNLINLTINRTESIYTS